LSLVRLKLIDVVFGLVRHYYFWIFSTIFHPIKLIWYHSFPFCSRALLASIGDLDDEFKKQLLELREKNSVFRFYDSIKKLVKKLKLSVMQVERDTRKRIRRKHF